MQSPIKHDQDRKPPGGRALVALSPARLTRLAWYAAGGWILVVGASLVWALVDERRQVLALARADAGTRHERDLLYRRWASMHGGVYVPPTAETPPNPYLEGLAERDVVTTTGRHLTLINPAYMTRQVHELAKEDFGSLAHITSLDPIRPENKPDPWEAAALRAFARGAKEVTSVERLEGADHLRLMRPMVVEPSCLKCHDRQGYKMGDIRGGISVSVPLAPYWAAVQGHVGSNAIFHLAFAGLGLAGIFGVQRKFGRRLEEANRAVEALAASEERWQTALESAGDGLWDWQIETGEVYFSTGWCRMLGYEPSELKPHVEEWEKRVHPDDLAQANGSIQRHFAGETPDYESEHRLRCKDGTYKWILDRGRIVRRSPEGRPLRMIGTHKDTTTRRVAEETVRKEAEQSRLLLELYARSADLTDKQIFDQVIDVAVTLTDSRIGFLHRVDDDQNTILLTTWNHEAQRHCTAEFETHYPISLAGNWVDCVRERRPVVYNDFAHSPHQKGLPAGHPAICRFMSLPVMEGGKVRIIFGVGNKPSDYNDADLNRLQLVGAELHKILTRKHAERDLKQTELALRASEQRYRLLVENTAFPVTVTSLGTGRVLFANRRALEYFELDGGRATGLPAADFWANPEDRKSWLATLRAEHRVNCQVAALRTAKGRIVWAEMTAVVIEFDGEASAYSTLVDITERKAMEEALRERERELALFFSQALDGFAFMMLDAPVAWNESADKEALLDYVMTHERVTRVNDAFLQQLGLPREQYSGVTPAKLFAHDPEAGRESWRQLYDQGRLRIEFDARKADGAIVWIEGDYHCLYDAQRRITGHFGVQRDITKRKLAEIELSRSQVRLARAMEFGRMGSWEYDSSTDALTLNNQILALMGTTAGREGGTAMPFSTYLQEFVVAEDVGPMTLELRRLSAESSPGEEFQLEHRIRRRDGAIRHLLVRIVVIRDTTGRTVGSRGVNIDITERKQAEIALRASEARFRGIVEGSGVAYFRIDRAGNYEAVNPAWLAMHRFESAAEVVGRHFSLTQVEQDLPGAEAIVRRLLTGEAVAPGNFSRRCRDGSIGYHTFSCQPVRQGYQVIGIEGFLIDTTPLHRAREDYRMLFDRMIDAFALHEIICDENGRPRDYRFLAVNPAFERLTGLSAAAIVGRTVREAMPSTEERWIEIYGRVALTGEPVSFSEYAGALDRYFEVSAFRPAPGQFACTFVDVTARQKADHEIRKLARAVEQSPVTVVITDLTGKIEYANPQFTRATGYTLDEARGQNPRILKSGAQPPAVYAELWRTILAGNEWRGELCNRRKDGTLFWEEASISPVVDQAGHLTHFLAVKEDITDHRAAMVHLQEQAALLEASRDVILLVDLAGKVRYWNGGATALYGWSADEAVGRDLFELVYDEAHPRPLIARREILARGEWAGEMKQRTKKGETLFVAGRGVLMRDAAGAPTSIMLTGRDVTEARRTEALLQRAQRMESIGALASGVAHDLNNVLSPIMISIELLRPLAVRPEDREVIKLLSDSARRGADVVRQLLLFGRGSEAPGEVFDLGNVLKEIRRMVRETFPRGISVGGTTARDLWSLRGHATQLYQVLLNLCLNARDAMAEYGTLTIGAQNFQAEEGFVRQNPEARIGRYVELSVTDTGAGIPAEIVDRIFDPFFTTKEQGKGTGLGLSTVLGIVRSHGGFLTVSSQVGAGTTFLVFLPAVEGNGAIATAEAVAETKPGGKGKVLVVDDEESIRYVLGGALRQQGFEVTTAASGQEALNLVSAPASRMVAAVIDMMMGGVDGLELLRRLHRIAPDMPIVACSGLDRYRAGVAALGLPRVRFLRKPFAVDEVSGLLRELIENRSGPGAKS